jgi:hypothetical protein
VTNSIKLPTPLTIGRRIRARRTSDPPHTSDEGWADWIGVSSTNVSSVRYNIDAGQLEVRFRGGNTYRYSAVPETTYLAFLNATSKGRFISRGIKNRFIGYKV